MLMCAVIYKYRAHHSCHGTRERGRVEGDERKGEGGKGRGKHRGEREKGAIMGNGKAAGSGVGVSRFN